MDVLPELVAQGRSALLRSRDKPRVGFLQQAVAGGGAIIANTGPVSSWRNNGIIAHAGLNYHLHWFDAAPVVARY